MSNRKGYVPSCIREGTQIYRVLQALYEVPGLPMTSIELADETGLSLKHCSGYMYTLRKMGLAKSEQVYRPGVNAFAYQHWVGEWL